MACSFSLKKLFFHQQCSFLLESAAIFHKNQAKNNFKIDQKNVSKWVAFFLFKKKELKLD